MIPADRVIVHLRRTPPLLPSDDRWYRVTIAPRDIPHTTLPQVAFALRSVGFRIHTLIG